MGSGFTTVDLRLIASNIEIAVRTLHEHQGAADKMKDAKWFLAAGVAAGEALAADVVNESLVEMETAGMMGQASVITVSRHY